MCYVKDKLNIFDNNLHAPPFVFNVKQFSVLFLYPAKISFDDIETNWMKSMENPGGYDDMVKTLILFFFSYLKKFTTNFI